MRRRRRTKAFPAGCGARAVGRIAVERIAVGRIAVVLALVAATSDLPGWAVAPAAAARAAQPLPVMMTVACVEAGEDGVFHLIRASDPEAVTDRLPPRPEPAAALGGNRIRLIGTLEEFGVVRHVGHKVWAKGLLIEERTERRLNLVSITHLSADCE